MKKRQFINLTLTAPLVLTFRDLLAKETRNREVQMENLKLDTKWDKVFKQSDKVDHSKVAFHNRYGVTLAADLYIPKNASGRLPAIADFMPRRWRKTASLRSPLTRHSPVRAGASPVILPLRISIPKTLMPQWTIFQTERM